MAATPFEIVLLDGPCAGSQWNEGAVPDSRILVSYLDGALVSADRSVPDLVVRSLVYECVDHIGLAFHFRFVEVEIA